MSHKVAIILAFFTCFIVAFPQIYFRIEHRDDGIYQGIELLPDSPWSARIREIQDGNGFGSIYYKEGKDNPYLFQPLGSMTVGYMGKMMGLDINNTILLSRFVLPFFTVLIMYTFIYLVSKDKLLALSATAMVLMADTTLSLSGIERIFNGMSPSSFLELARPVNSAMIFIPFFGFLISFWIFYNKREWRYGLLSSVLLGLNFYNYFYTWTYLYAFGGVLVLIFILRKKWREAFKIASIFVGAILLLIPYAINLYHASNHPAYDEVSLRFGIVMTHAPLFVGLVVLGALLVFFLGFPREDKDKYYFSLALLLTPFITLNQQLITGKILQPGHYHWYFHKPIAIIFILAILFLLLDRLGKSYYKKILAILIVILSFAIGGFIQAKSYYHDFPNRDGGEVLIERQKYGPVMRWLNDNVINREVVFGNDETSHMTVIYTPLDVFYHRAGLYTLSATKGRLMETLFTFYRLRGVEENNVRDVFYNERGYLSANIYGMHYKEALGSYEAIPDQEVEEIILAYRETFQIPVSKWLEDVFEKYEVEYVIWDQLKDPTWNLDQFSFIKKTFESGNIVIYRFIK